MEDKKLLFEALVRAQSEFKTLPKTRQGYGYKYADLADLMAYMRPILAKHRLAILQPLCYLESKVGVRTIIIHESGQSIEDVFYFGPTMMKGVNNMQALGASITYARRYALSLLGIVTDEDTDAITEKKSVVQAPDEQPENNLKEIGSENYIIDFGKHKGKALDDLPLDSIRSYVTWLEKQPKKNPKSTTFINIAKEYLAIADNDEQQELPIGHPGDPEFEPPF